jgi:hypothetical protein
MDGDLDVGGRSVVAGLVLGLDGALRTEQHAALDPRRG